MKKTFKVILVIFLGIIVILSGIALYVKTALPNVGPSPDIKVAITPERVERGNYLANNVSICMDCHSKRDWNMYAGPIIEGTFGGGGEKFGREGGFPGTLYSKNLTPYALHNWTDGEIFRAITSGETKDGKALFPLMGYPAYGKMDREDVYSIIAYVRTLPQNKNEVPERELDFPMNFIINTIPSKATLAVKPDTNNTIAYGGYLITIARCVECHSKVDKGSVIAGTEFGGGREFDFPNGTSCYSANITPDKETGIGKWSKEAFVQRFKQYRDSSYHIQSLSKTDFNTVMPWLMYSGITTKDLSSIYEYLQTIKPVKNKVQNFIRKS
ncbi:MAG: cytochrome C [Ginsengibacter sp.]